jgi:hypothetical protein
MHARETGKVARVLLVLSERKAMMTCSPRLNPEAMVHQEAVGHLKNALKAGDRGTACDAYHYLRTEFSNTRTDVKKRCLNAINVLFLRSKHFREVTCADIRQLAASVLVEVDNSMFILTINAHVLHLHLHLSRYLSMHDEQQYCMAAVGVAGDVRQAMLAMLELWDIRFGSLYPQLRALCRFLRESKRVEMPNMMVCLTPA